MMVSTQIISTKIFGFIAVLVFKLLNRKALFKKKTTVTVKKKTTF